MLGKKICIAQLLRMKRRQQPNFREVWRTWDVPIGLALAKADNFAASTIAIEPQWLTDVQQGKQDLIFRR
ncbi:protein of unknown function [Paraburkholderia kururiensis]